ncbi:YbhB/YbcL family Raf kinase inhibitor-like protein [uncultured Legionella sp.]|uniref:YbhB/YbcL family Raf kinase inhibitor-like protein n=1 Tax=uncultured Legionella sp. TaxID=210934 RepID=UPI00261184A9|nr:YbhB/YbcL family Raf kinase inhibitor-like protein [uncultured Legionella sp.]
MNKSSLFGFLFLGLFSFNETTASFILESPAFKTNTLIPDYYSCSGKDISPPLSWKDVPAKTQSLAVVVLDPDAADGQWAHWLLFNIPPSIKNLKANSDLPEGSGIGKNSWETVEYRGPCPPIGAVHRYVFTLYALDTTLSLEDGASKDEVFNAMTGHVIGSAELVGLYQKLPTPK